MTSEPTNTTRRERAENALQSYIEARGEEVEGSISEIGDLIADLLHLAASKPLETKFHATNVDYALSLAKMHFEAEHNNPEEE